MATRELQPARLLALQEDDWHPDRDNTLRVGSGHVYTSASGISSAVEDGGDSQQLDDIAEKRLSGKGSNDVDYAGARFPSENDIERPHSLPEDFDGDRPEPLGKLIRRHMLIAASSTKSQFLPLSDLEAIVTYRNIRRELERSGVTSDLDRIADQVWSTKKLSNGTTTRRKIFAILCLMERAQNIQDFIYEDVFDSHLPFEFEHNQNRVLRNNKSPVPIELFIRWQDNDRDSFRNYQGGFLAPYLKFTAKKLKHYTLHHCIVLPFLERETKGNIPSDTVATYFSVVYRVEIHSAHHDYHLMPHFAVDNAYLVQGNSSKAYFAVKQLQKIEAAEHSRRKAYDREVAAYKRLNFIQHSHIVRLLATYEHHDRLHMIFPWADGNLFQFWNDHFPNIGDLSRGPVLARWMIRQILGLAEGLNCIHKSDTSSASGDVLPEDKKRTHGRHGDIKPENILWFKDTTRRFSTDNLGKLTISDLGSTEFHGTLSREVQASAAGGFTPTYKSPEFDDKKRVQPGSDIWSFGCVLFQFVVWYVLGWQGVDEFSKRRMKDSMLSPQLDNFFHLNESTGSAEVKQSVRKEFATLREHPIASDFIMNLLNLIESELLLLHVDHRASSGDTVTKLETIKASCVGDQQYCTEKTTRGIQTTPIGPSGKVEIPLSDEMKPKYANGLDPSVCLVSSANTKQNLAASGAEEDKSGTEEGDSDMRLSANDSGDQAKISKGSAAAEEPHAGASTLVVPHEEPQRQRRNRLQKVAYWVDKLSCFRS
ncbi:hypothetical protein J4E82_002313 [Alternaria postmessia]|uniref:uncharacterized protein n=1 Tax=Alternaria postmessia TaxID=1187938 RepID=UPI002223F181|nr:uncharacterized protein J4E82_002313 [Alternaria postmessia]KAI5378862.1 hypothetical protein J4E82_002313 [Alternaria postmessia]